jgi:hypothetical protein
VVALSVALAICTPVVAADLTGAWIISWEPDFGGNLDSYECTFKQSGRTLTIDCRGDAMRGEVDERKVTGTSFGHIDRSSTGLIDPLC